MKLWKIVLLSLVAMVAVAGIGLVRWMRPYDLDTERKAARAAGIPLTRADLNIPVLAPNENAATQYHALKALEKRRPLDIAAFNSTWKSGSSLALMDTHSAALLEKLISSRPDVTRLVHAAAAKPRCWFQFEWSPTGVATQFPQLASIRGWAKWIRWESALMAREGRFADAVKNQALGLRIARHVADEPMFIAYLVSIACEAITMQGFQDILAMAGPNAPVADAVRREVASYDSTGDLTRCLKGEMVFNLTMMHDLTTLGGPTGMPPTDGRLETQSRAQGNKITNWWYTNPSQAVYIHWMMRTIEASRGPGPKRAEAMRAVEREMKREMGMRPTAVLTGIMLPVFSKAAGRRVQADARRTLVSAMASVLAYRARTGKYPNALDNAITPVPTDPFTGKPLGYRREGAGFVVFADPDTSGADAKAAAKLRRTNTIHYPPVIAPVSTGRPLPGGPPMPGSPPMPGGPPIPIPR